MNFNFPQFRLSQVLSVAVGVAAFDYLFCGVIAPKVFQWLGLAPQIESDCHCGGGCNDCAKNITDRAQVIDITPFNQNLPVKL